VAKRLFVGLEMPEVSREILAKLDPKIRGVRWLPPEQIHMTLSFLGDVFPEAEDRLRESLSAIKVPAFFLPVQGIRTFGGARPSIVWAGVGKGHPHLFALHKHVQDAVIHAGLEPDLRPFCPHITLARAKDVSKESLLPFLRHHAQTEFDLWKVEEFVLFSSKLSREGPTYTIELRQRLL
jgi:2'-5' RNA ligase